MLFGRLLIFSKSTFPENYFRNAIRVSKDLNPDQAQRFVEPNLGPNCLQGLSADDTSRQRVNGVCTILHIISKSGAICAFFCLQFMLFSINNRNIPMR